jgi:polyhydroxyalkanoate synthase
MMKAFTFQAPPNILFEPGASRKIAEIVGSYSVRRVLLVTDKGVRDAGLTKGAEAALEEGGLELSVFDAVEAYGLVGRYTMADLQPDRSLIRSLLNKGLDLWLIDWGQPGRNERWLTIDDYVDDYIDAAVDKICTETGHDKITLLGICEGGVFSVCYAALHPKKVRNLVVTITPIDFHADVNDKAAHHGFINLWTRSLDPEDIDKLVETYGVLPGEFMSSVFSMMTPMRSLTKYNVDLIDVIDDEDKFMNFLRMEKWLADRPHHPGEAAKQWLKELYQDNRLIDGSFELSGRRVDLKAISAPVLNVFALDDHIIPPDCSRALGEKIGSDDYTEIPLPGGSCRSLCLEQVPRQAESEHRRLAHR